jgi:hypothetical protein
LSFSPQTTSVGTVMRCSQRSNDGLNQRGSQPSLAAAKRLPIMMSACCSEIGIARIASAIFWL